MGCLWSNNASDYEQVTPDDNMILIDDNSIESTKLKKHQRLSSRPTRTISTDMIKKIYCHLIRHGNLQSIYYRDVLLAKSILHIITFYVEDFYTFDPTFKYSKILLSNHDHTATILTSNLFDCDPQFAHPVGDRFILYGLPIFPRKNFIYCASFKVEKCANQTVAVSFVSDYFYFKLNFLMQKHIQNNANHVENVLDKEILGRAPSKYGSYTMFCNGRHTETWTHHKKKSFLGKTNNNYLEKNIDFAADDMKSKTLHHEKSTKIQFGKFEVVHITIDGFEDIVRIENRDRKVALNIPKCYTACECEEDHFDKTDNLKNNEYCCRISEDGDCFIYPTYNIIHGDEHNPQFQIGFVLYDGDNSHGQVSILNQSWTYLT
eukprot:269023_1